MGGGRIRRARLACSRGWLSCRPMEQDRFPPDREIRIRCESNEAALSGSRASFRASALRRTRVPDAQVGGAHQGCRVRSDANTRRSSDTERDYACCLHSGMHTKASAYVARSNTAGAVGAFLVGRQTAPSPRRPRGSGPIPECACDGRGRFRDPADEPHAGVQQCGSIGPANRLVPSERRRVVTICLIVARGGTD